MRELKVHYISGSGIRMHEVPSCGESGRMTPFVDRITCRRCMFFYLVDQAPWARAFLDGLRKSPGVGAPAPLTEPMDSVVEGPSRSLGRPFSEQRVSEKAIRELLPPRWITPEAGAVEIVMDDRGTPGVAARIKEGQVAEGSRDAGQIGLDSSGNG